MQIILHLNYKNIAYERFTLDTPYYLLSVHEKPILLHTLLGLKEKTKVENFLFILHKELCDIEKIERSLVEIMREINIPFRTVISNEMNSPLGIESHLLEDVPLVFMEPTIQYQYMDHYLDISKDYACSQLYVDEIEVAMIYFRSKHEYLNFRVDTIDILEYKEEDISTLVWLNTPQRYLHYINSETMKATTIETTYSASLHPTCSILFKILQKGEGFRLDHYCIAVILEGSCITVGAEITCAEGTILAGEGVFLATEFSKVLFIEDRSILDKKAYCALIDIKQAFPNGTIISDQPPSMFQTDAYEVHCIQREEEPTTNFAFTSTKDIYLLYDGTIFFNDTTVFKDVAVEIPKGQWFVKNCMTACKYILIRIKENAKKDTHGGETEGI